MKIGANWSSDEFEAPENTRDTSRSFFRRRAVEKVTGGLFGGCDVCSCILDGCFLSFSNVNIYVALGSLATSGHCPVTTFLDCSYYFAHSYGFLNSPSYS